MALNPDEKRRAANHLRSLRFSRPALFESGVDVDAALADATDDQVTTIQEMLPDLDRMKDSMIAIDSRFKARVVGKVQLNPNEWGNRLTQYEWLCVQLGALLAVISPLLSYAISTDADRGW